VEAIPKINPLDFRILFGYTLRCMIQKIHAPISVVFVFNHHKRQAMPVKILWEGREYCVTRVGLHHTYREGKILFHVFSVETPSLFFRIILNTDSLFWFVEEISDGEPN
jgi:hypothetical protein